MSTIIIVVSLTEVCSSLVVAAPSFVGVNVVGGSKSYAEIAYQYRPRQS